MKVFSTSAIKKCVFLVVLLFGQFACSRDSESLDLVEITIG